MKRDITSEVQYIPAILSIVFNVISFVHYFLDFYMHDFFVKELSLEVMASFTYCDIHLDSWMTQPSALLQKTNDG